MKNLFRLRDVSDHRTDGENGWGRRLADAFKTRGRGGSGGNRTSTGTRRPLFEPLEQRQLLTVDPHVGMFMPTAPETGVVYEQIVVDSIDSAGEADSFTVDLQKGQTISLLADGDLALKPKIELLAPGGASLGVGTAATAAGQAGVEAIVAPQTGTYTVSVTGAGGTIGGYGVKVLLNSTLESESYGGAANDSASSAQDLDSVFVELGGGLAELASVAGSLPGYSAGFESGQLDEQWRPNTQPYAETEVTSVRGAAEGTEALLLHWEDSSNDLEHAQAATWTVDLAGLDDPVLSFEAASWLNLSMALRHPFTGDDTTGTGVAISQDGENWYPLTSVTSNYPDPTPWTKYSVDLAAQAQELGISLDGEVQLKFLRYTTPVGQEYDGVAYDAIQITSATENADWYKFALNDGQVASIEFAGSSLGSAMVELYDSSMNLLTATTATGDGESVLQQFTDSTSNGKADTYFVRVVGKETDYQLSVVRDAGIEAVAVEAPNPQELTSGIPVLGSVSRKQTRETTDVDVYQVQVRAGDQIKIRTTTPTDKSDYIFPENHPTSLDPLVRLVSPSGSVLASNNNGAGDSLNSLLTYTASETGTYTVEVERVGSTFGEYLLELNGATGTATEFAVVSTAPAAGETTKDPTVYQVHLNREVDASSLDASDLKINGQSAASVRLADGQTIEFTLPSGLTEQSYTASIAAGAFVDIDGRAIPAFSATFLPDVVSPYVVSSTLSDGGTVPVGDLAIEMQFNESLLASVLDAGDVQLVGVRTGSHTPAQFSYNAATSTLNLQFDDLGDDSYTLTLISGDAAFRDVVGHGLQGGDLVIEFSAEAGNVALDDLEPIGALGPQAYHTEVTGLVTGDADTYTLELAAGETISLLVNPDSTLRATIEISGPGGSSVATAAAASTGESVVLQNVLATQGGTYTIAIGQKGGSSGEYTLDALKNAVHENTTLDEDTPENVDASFRSLTGNQGEQLVVYGSLHALGESFESGEPSDGWYWEEQTAPVVPVFPSTEWGSVDGDTALMMHGPMWGAIWNVDVSEIENPILSFWHASWEGAGQSLNFGDQQAYNDDDGIMVMGIHGYKESQSGGSEIPIHEARKLIWLPPDQKAGEWVHYSLDLSEVYMDPLPPILDLHFRQVDWYDTPGYGYVSHRLLPEVGRGWDAILITSADPIGDWYEFTLEDGESASLAMASEGLPAEAVLEVYDDAGNLLAVGDVDDDNVLRIEDFRDTTSDGKAQTYRVRAGAVVTTPDWDYSLSIMRGAATGTSSFEIVSVTEADPVGTIPTFDVAFNDGLALNTLDVEDFMVGGLPAESIRWIDGHTVRVQPSVLSSGTWSLEVGAGSVSDLQGTQVRAFSGSVAVSGADSLLGANQPTVFFGEVEAAGSADEWLVQLGAGQSVTVVVEGDSLAADIRLLVPNGSEVAAKTGAAGSKVIIEYTATTAGAYRVVVGGTGGTTGEYEGSLLLDTLIEKETTDGTSNDTMASAENLDGSFVDLGDAGEAVSVSGELPNSVAFRVEEKFDELPANYDDDITVSYLHSPWATNTTHRHHVLPRFEATFDGDTFVDGYLKFPSTYSDTFDADPSMTAYYDATWTVDLSDLTDTAILSFDYRVDGQNIAFQSFNGSFTNKTEATGIAISEDGSTWYPVWNAAEQTIGEWVTHSVDLMAVAEAAGITLDDGTKIRFQHYAVPKDATEFTDTFGFDNIRVSSIDAIEDWYRFSLADGQAASVIAKADSIVRIALYNQQGNLVAEGSGENARQLIDHFTDGTSDGGSDTYYVKVTRADGPYSLVVARDVAAGWADNLAVPEHIVGPRLSEHVIPSKIEIGPVAPNDTYEEYENPTIGYDPWVSWQEVYGQDNAPAEFGTPATEVDLGVIEHTQVPNVKPAGGTLAYRITATNLSYMTVIGRTSDSGTLYLKLEDTEDGRIMYSMEVNGAQRLDLPARTDREFILYVTGTSTDANLELMNIVSYRELGGVWVRGTDGDDAFVFDASSGVVVTANGVPYPIRDPVNLKVLLDGNAGDDTALLIGATGEEKLEIFEPIDYGSDNIQSVRGKMLGEGWSVYVYQATPFGEGDSVVVPDAGSDDMYGQENAPVEFGTPGAETNLGVVEHTQVANVKPGGATLAYRITAENLAYMTVIGRTSDSGTLYLKLADAEDGETVYSVEVNGTQRLDLPASSDREFILYVTGTSTDASLELMNLVDYNASGAVRVWGTDGDDAFVFDASSGVVVTMNGVSYPIGSAVNLDVFYGGDGGADSATFIGSTGDEEIKIYPDNGQMTGEGWTVRVEDCTSIEVVGGGGIDIAFLYDSPGDEHLLSEPGRTTFSGDGYENYGAFEHVLTNVAVCHAYGKNGGNDTAVMHGADEGLCKFKVDAVAQWSKMYGGGTFVRAKFFESVDAYNYSDKCLARFFDSDGDETFTGSMDEASMVGADYNVRAHGFTQVIAYAYKGGNDKATLSDTAGDDEVRFRAHKTQMYDMKTDGDVYKLTVRAFDEVHASATEGGYDKAKLHDASDDDLFEAAGDTARMTTARGDSSVLAEALGFEFVKAYHTDGKDRVEEGDEIDFELYYEGEWE